MYKLSLELKKNNPFKNQTIFWYPLRRTTYGNLISINIATKKNFYQLDKLIEKGYVLSIYNLSQDTVCFIYHGSEIKQLTDSFGERSFITDNGKINYFFVENDLNDILKNFDGIDDSVETIDKDIQKIADLGFKKEFGENWYSQFSRILEPSKYCTNLVTPHPILQLIDYIDKEAFSKNYYKEMLNYLLHQDFLVTWINIKEIQETQINLYMDILNKCNEISKKEIKNAHDLELNIKKAVLNLFKASEIFQHFYYATQCSSDNSSIKYLSSNLYTIYPKKVKNYAITNYCSFQPKFAISGIEFHLIKTATSNNELFKIYSWLKKISTKVKFYDAIHHEMLSDDELIRQAIRHHNVNFRCRFICDLSFPHSIDYSKLHYEVHELGNAILSIMSKPDFFVLSNLENGKMCYKNELWIKRLKLEVHTPIQFEKVVKYSLSQKWITVHSITNDYVDLENGAKFMFFDLFCDYSVFFNNAFAFSLAYMRDILSVYSTLNIELKSKYNLSVCSVLTN